MRAWPKGNYEPVTHGIAGAIIAATAVTSVVVSPLVGFTGFFLVVGAATYLFRKSDFNREAKRLQKRGYIALVKGQDGWRVSITKKGRRRLRQIEIKKMKLPHPKTWDGKWRLVVFDVPEKYRYARDAMRDNLKRLGFYNFQRSALAYPYGCRDEVDEIADYHGLEKYSTYAETSFIDIERELRRHFAL